MARAFDSAASTDRSVHSVHWVAFQSPGERALRRRREASDDLLALSTLPVTNPAFTRDVANNIWHVRADDAILAVVRRLQALVTWPDEHSVLLTEKDESAVLPPVHLDLSDALIPVAEKERYAWRDDLTLF